MTPLNDTLLTAFFSTDNDWDLEKIRAGGYSAPLQFHLEKLLEPALKSSLPCALPLIGTSRQLRVYVLGSSRRELSELVRVVHAHLGRVNVMLDPSVVMTAQHIQEKVLLDQFPHGFLRVSIPNEVNADKEAVYAVFGRISSALERYSARPQSVSFSQRPIGRILSDFFVAFNRSDGDAAYKLLDELRETKKLDARNLVSIELQAMAAASRWQQLLAHPSLQEILAGRIPGVLTEIILKGIKQQLMPSESPANYEMVLLEKQLASLGGLFTKVPSLDMSSSISIWKAWAIGAVALGYSRAFELIPVDVVGKGWVDELRQWSGFAPNEEAIAAPVVSAIDLVPSFEAAVTLLGESISPHEPDVLAIYKRLREYPEEILGKVREHSGLARIWNGLVEDFGQQRSIETWSGWFQSLLDAPEDALSLTSVLEVYTTWQSSDWNEAVAKEQLFALVDSSSWEIVRDAVPVIRQWLVNNSIRISADLSSQLLMMMAVDDDYSPQDLALIEDLIDDLTNTRHSQEQYKDAIDAAISCWGRVGSPTTIGQGLELMDVLLDSTCADSQARLGYWDVLQGFCLSSWQRLSRDQHLLVRQFAEEVVGSSSQFPSSQVVDDVEVSEQVDLSGKRLAIYTLTEGAGRRARLALLELFPGLEIQLNHDKSATAALKNLAKTADFFIFASRSAAHQAFYPVSEIRDHIIYPAGKGSSSIIQSFQLELSSAA